MKIGSRQSIEPRIDLIVMYTALTKRFQMILEGSTLNLIDFLLNPFFCISKRSVCELIVFYVHMLLYKNDIKV